MADLTNDFPSWGETGTLPADGFFYEGGDQVNEKHLDALWNNVKTHFDRTHTGIRDRVREIEGDLILDSGLVVSQGTNTREVDVSGSSAGAYVDGQRTGSTSATTVSLSSNGTTNTRTDAIWVDTKANIGATEGTTTVADDRTKIAEVDVAPNDTIAAIRNTGHDRTRQFAAETPDSGQIPGGTQPGDVWYDLTADTLKGRINGAWRALLPADGSQPLLGGLNVNGNDLTNVNAISGDGSETYLRTAGASLTLYDSTNGVNIVRAQESGAVSIPNGPVDVGDDVQTTGGATIWDAANGQIPVSRLKIKDGEAQAIDAAEFDGSAGTADQVLQTDGTTASWAQIPNASVSEDGSEVLSTPDDIDFTNGITVTDDGDNTVSIDADENSLAYNFVLN